jgi:hypothetical protein
MCSSSHVCYNIYMSQSTKIPSKKAQKLTESFIKKYRPALKELAKK